VPVAPCRPRSDHPDLASDERHTLAISTKSLLDTAIEAHGGLERWHEIGS
jgi:hypothetical protein